MIDRGVYRTAPATAGLLNILMSFFNRWYDMAKLIAKKILLTKLFMALNIKL